MEVFQILECDFCGVPIKLFPGEEVPKDEPLLCVMCTDPNDFLQEPDRECCSEVTMEEYVFLPDDLKAQIPALYSQEGVEDPTVYMKFFTPWTSWTWFITEGEDRNGDYLMFGYTIGMDREWGYISLNELSLVTGPFGLKIERDIHFSPKKKSEIPEIR